MSDSKHIRSSRRLDLGPRIAEARMSAGMTQYELAAIMGASRGWLAHLEQGRKSVNVVSWSRLTRALPALRLP